MKKIKSLFFLFPALGSAACLVYPLVFLHLASGPLLAQDLLQKPATSSKRIVPDTTREILEWKVLLAEKSLSVQESDLERANLLLARQSLVEHLCMPQLLRTLQYDGPSPDNTDCAKAIKDLSVLDPDNPSLICAREGIDSEECQQASLTRLSMSQGEYKARVSKKFSSSRNSFEVPSGFSEIDKKWKTFEERKGLAELAALNNEYEKAFRQECADIQTFVQPRSFLFPEEASLEGGSQHDLLNDREAARNKKDSSRNEELMDLIEKLESAEERAPKTNQGPIVPENAKVLRIRVLPDTCFQLAGSLLRKVPHSSLAICQRDGLQSRFCVQAIRQEKETIRKKYGAGKAAPGNVRSPAGRDSFVF